MNHSLFVLTASNPEAYQHYIDTIERGFPINDIKEFLSEDQYIALRNLCGEEHLKAWGATPGKGNIATWNKMNIGDPILIYRQGNFEYYAFIAFKLHNVEIAKKLWRTNIKGETWEYVYFLDKLTEISVPVKIFNESIGYKDNFTPQGFSSVDKKKVDYLKEKFGSIESFLNYLAEGKWIERETAYPREVKETIIQERVSRQLGRTSLLEANLENYLADRVAQIEPGLKLIGRQLDTKEVGRLDLLCEDKDKNLVVVELKRGTAGSSIIDQIQRYMGWMIAHKAQPNQKVRGIVIVASKDTALEYAVKANPMVQIKTFNISVQ